MFFVLVGFLLLWVSAIRWLFIKKYWNTFLSKKKYKLKTKNIEDEQNIQRHRKITLYQVIILTASLLAIYLNDRYLKTHFISFISIFLMLVGVLLPFVFKKIISKIKQDNIDTALPFFIDLLTVALQSGMSLHQSLKYVNENFKLSNDLSKMISMTIRHYNIYGLENSLQFLTRQTDNSNLHIFCNILYQSSTLGTPLYVHLNKLTKELKEMQFLKLEEKAATLPTKIFLISFVFFIIPFVIMITYPNLSNMNLSNIR